ncbi:uncharacterized protein [Anoplolepis gracilipes]|uniref:uncharacterized protein n=1 Tax=Anoplolepis gracilipes TaxID=354296 RepID=UPI003B9E01EE
MTYAAVVWWPRVEKVGARNLLKSLQDGYLRAAVGAMKTTPTEALEVALCIPPLDQRIICAAKSAVYRLYCQREWRYAGPGHTRLTFLQDRPFTLKQDRSMRKYHLGKTFKVLIPDRADWENQRFIDRLSPDVWYTDSSGNNGRYGAGIYAPKYNHKTSIPIGGLATVFQAEVLAILECANLQITAGAGNKNIVVCSDSQAALAKPTTESSLIWDCMQALNQLREHNKVTLMWIPGHQGIQGNEVAEHLRAHMSILGLATQDTCRLCGEDREDSVHILCRCPALVLKRYRHLRSMFLEPGDLKNKKINNLCKLAENAGLGLQR